MSGRGIIFLERDRRLKLTKNQQAVLGVGNIFFVGFHLDGLAFQYEAGGVQCHNNSKHPDENLISRLGVCVQN